MKSSLSFLLPIYENRSYFTKMKFNLSCVILIFYFLRLIQWKLFFIWTAELFFVFRFEISKILRPRNTFSSQVYCLIQLVFFRDVVRVFSAFIDTNLFRSLYEFPRMNRKLHLRGIGLSIQFGLSNFKELQVNNTCKSHFIGDFHLLDEKYVWKMQSNCSSSCTRYLYAVLQLLGGKKTRGQMLACCLSTWWAATGICWYLYSCSSCTPLSCY